MSGAQFKIDGINFEAVERVLTHLFGEVPGASHSSGLELMRKDPHLFMIETLNKATTTQTELGRVYFSFMAGVALAMGSNSPTMECIIEKLPKERATQ